MKNDIKQKFLKQQKKQKIKTILKWVFCGVGWTALIGSFIGLVALGCKGCANKKVDSDNKTRIIGDYTLNKRVIEDLPYKYYYRYNNYEGFEDYNKSVGVVLNDATIRLKHLDNDTIGDNGTYKTYVHLELDIFNRNENIECQFLGSVSGTALTDYELLYETTYDKLNQTSNITSYIQLGFVDSSVDLKNYEGDNDCLIYLSNIIKYNCVDNLNLSFDMNNQINRFAMLGQANSVFGTTFHNAPYLGNRSWCLKGYFKDNLDNYYIGIKILYVDAAGLAYLDTSTGTPQVKTWDRDIHNACAFINLYYVKTDGTEISVNKPVYTISNNAQVYTGASEWVADSFRHLTIFYFENVSTELPISSYSGLERLQMFNNNTYTNDLGITDGNGVFGLLGQAFSSVASILNLQIIPGITLGLFIFIPFSIMILIACVWLFKR